MYWGRGFGKRCVPNTDDFGEQGGLSRVQIDIHNAPNEETNDLLEN